MEYWASWGMFIVDSFNEKTNFLAWPNPSTIAFFLLYLLIQIFDKSD